jgi:hypothetical protein
MAVFHTRCKRLIGRNRVPEGKAAQLTAADKKRLAVNQELFRATLRAKMRQIGGMSQGDRE